MLPKFFDALKSFKKKFGSKKNSFAVSDLTSLG